MIREDELSKSLVNVYDELVHIKTMSINDELTDAKLIESLSKCFNIIEDVDVIQL